MAESNWAWRGQREASDKAAMEKGRRMWESGSLRALDTAVPQF